MAQATGREGDKGFRATQSHEPSQQAGQSEEGGATKQQQQQSVGGFTHASTNRKDESDVLEPKLPAAGGDMHRYEELEPIDQAAAETFPCSDSPSPGFFTDGSKPTGGGPHTYEHAQETQEGDVGGAEVGGNSISTG